MDNGLWKEKPFTKAQAWLDILINTSYADSCFWSRGVKIEAKKGQCAMSQLTMAKRWGWSRKKVQTFLNYLKSSQQIEHQTNNVTCLITIINWDKYQTEEHQIEQQKSTKRAPKEHIQEVKEVKTKTYSPEFEQFWKMYPRKVSKGDAEKAWKKITRPVETLALIKMALDWQKTSHDWKKENGQFVPYPASYLNGRKWEDEPKQQPTFQYNFNA